MAKEWVRCTNPNCRKRMFDVDTENGLYILFGKLYADIQGGELRRFDCPKCGQTHFPPFESAPITEGSRCDPPEAHMVMLVPMPKRVQVPLTGKADETTD